MVDLAVIMSVYKNDKLKYLRESVQSILDQTFTLFHFFIVFDGPVAVDIESYITSLNDNRIKLYKLEKNEGLAVALNFLLEIVMKNPEYKFIARMDADDISGVERFEVQRNFLSVYTSISIVGCWYEEIDDLGRHLSKRKLPVDHDALVKYYYWRAPFAHPSVLFTRELIEKAGFYPTDTILMEDNVLWGRALQEGLKFANIPEFLLKFRIDQSFIKRRSGFNYGSKYIVLRFKINKSLHFPIYTYLFTCAIGIIKMMPTFVKYPIYYRYSKSIT